MLKPLKLPTNAWSPWKARSELAKDRLPRFAGLKKPSGLLRWAARSSPLLATPALSKPAESPTRGSSVVGSCAEAAAVSAPKSTSVPPSTAPRRLPARVTRTGTSRSFPIPVLPFAAETAVTGVRSYSPFMEMRNLLTRSQSAALAVAAAFLIGGCLGGSDEPEPTAAAEPNVVQAGAPGEPSRELSSEELAKLEEVKHTQA